MIIFEFIVELFVQIILEGIIGNFFKVFFNLFRKIGVFILKLITLNRMSFEELDKEYYKDSVMPYLTTFFIILGIVYLTQL